MNIVFGIVIGIVILMTLVVLHEFGHFIMARKNGVKVNEFGIGFPPRAIAWVKKPVEIEKDGKKITKEKWVKLPKSEWGKPQDSLIFSLNYLPIGGFCSMDGESDADTKKGTFGAASFWGKTKILFGGVLMNWLAAFVILTILAFTGMPQFINNQFVIKSDAHYNDLGGVAVAEVIDGSPAAKAGFRAGDKIVKVADTEVLYPETITTYGTEHRGEEVTYTILRDGNEQSVTATLNPADAEYALGIQMSYSETFIRSTWSAPIVGFGTTLQLTGETFRGLGELVWNLITGVGRQFSLDSNVREAGQVAIGSVGDAVSGPVGIIGVLFPAFASTGATNLAFLAAIISISLACMNVLPIPALDGGRWLLIALYRLRGKKLSKETEEKIVSRAFMALIGLIILITILDITKLF